MRRDDVLKTLDEHRAEIEERFGIRSLAIFGSVARDEAHEGSDPHVLVEFASAATFARYMALKLYLEDLFASRVDVVMPESPWPRLHPVVEREAIRVA